MFWAIFCSHLQGALICKAFYIFILCILVLFEYGYKNNRNMMEWSPIHVNE